MARHSLVPFNFTKDLEPFNWLRQEVDTLFDNFWKSPRLQPQLSSYARNFPLIPDIDIDIDIAETDKEFTVSVDVPGLEEKDINIDVRDNILRISGEKNLDHEEKDKNFYRIERISGFFDRSIQLPGSINNENVQANLKNGVLTITLPKSVEATSSVKHIEVKKA